MVAGERSMGRSVVDTMDGWFILKCLPFMLLILVSLFCDTSSQTGYTVELSRSNFDQVIGSNEVVFINFYANWCRFSQMLKPVIEDTAKAAREEFRQQGLVVVAALNCEAEDAIAKRYHISKYPTLKMFRNGKLAKREYRSQRSKDAFLSFLREQVKDNILQMQTKEDIQKVDETKRNVIAYFKSSNTNEYMVFKRVASALRDDCSFYVGIGDNFRSETVSGDNIMFRPPRTKDQDMLYMGSMVNFNLLHTWSQDKCIPLVREITFENGEELTEEGLPFLILFHRPEDVEIVKRFNGIISRELVGDKGSINFLTADGTKFSHPLHHLGKSVKDLPLIAIDSFRHMYLLPNIEDVDVPGKLKSFIQDLHSGKLHREFHHGPDKETPQATVQLTAGGQAQAQDKKRPTDPPESTFVKLKPSDNRYSFRDEL
ncbi:endoplasmic reticulum resident protein 44-like [Patiria miniata]|uniref:Thioredoxin domain-containing protein n=1 Tax=Patiria miniata TaxID=46514 RepID=A0A913ZBK7_PATMI|nr:endoplasmic reticulum resident protein 44-like [Patiria miniata]